ncbi:MAG: DUF535 family protein [Pseudomonadota bacterium]
MLCCQQQGVTMVTLSPGRSGALSVPEKSGRRAGSRGLYRLSLKVRRHPPEEVASKKRAEYRRRDLLPEEPEQQVIDAPGITAPL